MDTRTVINATTAARPTALAAVGADARLDQECAARLNWLLRANEQAAQHRKLFRDDREEEEMMLMRHPLSARRAFALYGLLAGTLPPAAIFYKTFGWADIRSETWLLLICVMNVACAAIGYWLGGVLSGSLADLKRKGWHRALLGALWLGALWGWLTGSLSGLVFFGIGAIFGAFYGLLGGMLAFALFTPLHRLLSRGDMIDARHFWPVACGITAALAALIVNL